MIQFVERRTRVIAFKSTATGRNFPFAPDEFAQFAAAIKRGDYDSLLPAPVADHDEDHDWEQRQAAVASGDTR